MCNSTATQSELKYSGSSFWHYFSATLIVCSTVLVPHGSHAAGWEINPVRVELSPQQHTSAIILKNNSDQPTVIQIQAVSWSQREGKDLYLPTKDLIVSPPIASIPAKGEQVIRVALRRAADTTNELTYRITLQELPPAQPPQFTGVQVALRIGLPVFVQPQQGIAAPKISWNVAQLPDKKLRVGILNQGNAHIQIADLEIYVPGLDQPLKAGNGSSYILAGQAQEWLLNNSSMEKLSTDHVRFRAYTDANNVDMELALDKP